LVTTQLEQMDTTGVTGEYESANGTKGDAVWSTRADWVSLKGVIDGDSVGVRADP
jgi:hypothetical protein